MLSNYYRYRQRWMMRGFKRSKIICLIFDEVKYIQRNINIQSPQKNIWDSIIFFKEAKKFQLVSIIFLFYFRCEVIISITLNPSLKIKKV